MAEDFPINIDVVRAEWYLQSKTQTHESPLSGQTQTLELPGAKWKATLIITELSQSDARSFFAFLAKLRGRAGTFNLWDHSHPTPAGVASGTPVVYGAGQTGSQLLTNGWAINTTDILKAGDYIQVGTELKIVVADADSDGSGVATLEIEPPWRSSPADAASIVTSYPKATMKLVNDDAGFRAESIFSSFTVECIESI